MALFRRKIRQRRLEVRRNIPSSRGQLWQRFIDSGGPGSLLIALGFTVAAVSLVISAANERREIKPGDLLPRRFARVDFQAPNAQRTDQSRELAARQTPYTYRLNETLMEQARTQLNALPTQLKGFAAAPEQLPADIAEAFVLDEPEQVQALAAYDDEALKPQWLAAVQAVMADLADLVILTPEHYEQERLHLAVEFRLAGDGMVTAVNKNDRPMAPLNEPRRISAMLQRIDAELPEALLVRIRHYLAGLLTVGNPTYTLDRAKSLADVEAARQAAGVLFDQYAENDLIFRGGRVGEADVTLLQAERTAWQRHLAKVDPRHRARSSLGLAATTAMIVLAVCAYIALYRPRIVRKHMRGLAVACLMLMMLSAVRLLSSGADWNPHMAIGAVTLVAMILTVAYDQRFGLATAAGFALLMDVMLGGDTALLVAMLIPTGVSVLLIGEIRTRSKLIEAGAVAAIAAAVALFTGALAGGSPVNARLLGDCGWAAGSVLAVGFIVQGILPLIERVFRIATAMTLLEWCDANKKLLKRLAMEAPGTFNHSLMLGTLCEAAAESIGANGLLARVGAYYHDIGKINKPRYFVENQFGSPSMHAKLSPAMSLLVITGHVKDGIEMAKEYNLPQVLHQFIATHHGTTLVKFFYHAAAKLNSEEGRPAPNDTEFRYPGPKPRTAEAAILMLADAVESSVRAMNDPTPARIEAQANAMLNDRLTDGQLDDCDLTLRDLHKIEQSLIKSLCGIYHGRIAYPQDDLSKPAAARPPRPQPAATGGEG